MAIVKLGPERYQVKVMGPDGRWITKVFPTKQEAQRNESDLKDQRYAGFLIPNAARKLTLDEYFQKWYVESRHRVSPGWSKCQFALYRDYISPHLGFIKLVAIKTPMVGRVFSAMVESEKSEQTQLHVYNLLRKLFTDAIEFYQYVSFNPVIQKIRPKLPEKEVRHLKLDDIVKLLTNVARRDFGVAIWMQLYLGLRVNEVIALKWSNVDLKNAIVHIRSSYSRKDAWALKDQAKGMKNVPKGGKHHSITIPPELLELLKEARETAKTEHVCPSPFTGRLLCYEYYLETLKSYCKELGLPLIGTHGLRHSTSELYQSNGATRDDLRQLFAHSSSDVTDRYIHTKGNIDSVMKQFRVFPGGISEPDQEKNASNSGRN
jgi:integrase